MSLPTNEEQEFLERINRLRSDPGGEFSRLILDAGQRIGANDSITSAIRFFNVDLNLFRQQMQAYAAVAPLAWNTILEDAAALHSARMIQVDSQSHQLPGEADLGQRIRNAGYSYSTFGENIYAFATSVIQGHAGFVIDWGTGPGGMQTPPGHRNNLLSASFAEIGVDVSHDNAPATAVGPLVVTQDIGNRLGYAPQILGVVFRDADGDHAYDPGEGTSSVTVTADGSGGIFTTTTWASGGYQFAVPQGVYSLTFSGGGLAPTAPTLVTLGASNVKIDLDTAPAAAPTDPVRPIGSATFVVTASQLTPRLVAVVTPSGRMGPEWRAVGAADLSDNGKAAMIWQNRVGQVAEWIMNGTAMAGFATSTGQMGMEWRLATTADFNNDGRGDLAWQSTAGRLAVWQMNGPTLVSVGVPTGQMGAEWRVAGAGDVNGDGRADAIWANGQGQVAVWQMNGTALTAAIVSIGRMGAEWQLTGTGDFSGDGKVDLLWTNRSGQVAIWTMNGANPTGVAISTGRNGIEWRVAAIADFDRDGRADILWQNTTGQAQLWFMQGANVARAVPLDGRMGTEWAIIGAQDLSGAGTPDIIWANSAGQVSIWDLTAADRIAGGGIYRTFEFDRLTDAGKEIVDFHAGAGGDVLDLHSLLTSLGYLGANPLGDGEVRLVQDGADTHVQLDIRPGAHAYVTVATLDNVAPVSLQAGNWRF
jgi:hypothetical protein